MRVTIDGTQIRIHADLHHALRAPGPGSRCASAFGEAIRSSAKLLRIT